MRHTLITLLALTITLVACAPITAASPTATAAPSATSAPTTTEAPSPTPTLSPADIAQELGLDLNPSYRVIINDYDVTCLENTADGSCVAVYDEKDKAWYKVQHWDDPELLASLKSDFEAKMGMSVEDYYNQARAEGWLTVGESDDAFGPREFTESNIPCLGVGARVVVTADGARHLVTYVARIKTGSEEIGLYPLDTAIEKDGDFAQTGLDTFTDLRDYNNYTYPVHYSSAEAAANELSQLVQGKMMMVKLFSRFRNLDSCSDTAYFSGYSDDGYVSYMKDLCLTEGSYLNTLTQEAILQRNGSEMASTYNLDQIMSLDIPKSGLTVLLLGVDVTQR